MNKKKIFFFSIFTIFLIIFVFEFGSRTLIYILTKNKDIFKYGFNKNIDLQIRKLTTLDFEVINNKIIISNKINTNNLTNEKKLIWTFGGSTSAISCRKANITSWPIEMENENATVKNYARSGTNTDFALNSLISLINLGKSSDIILWANYVNETNVINFGFKRNPQLAKKDETQLHLNKTVYFIQSLLKSIKNYSIFFSVLDRFFLGAIYRLNLDKMFFENKELSEDDIKLSAKNYYINTIKAINLSKKIRSEFYIVTLFSKNDLIEQEDQTSKYYNVKKKIFFETIKKIVNENKEVKWINLKEYKFINSTDINEMFCDEVHFTTQGNIAVAKIINKYLD